jgi:hypothetical protein
MMKTSEATLVQRTSYLYRRLLLLQRLFQVSGENDDADWLGTTDQAKDLALCGGIREVLDDLAEQASVLTTIPYPIRDWRPGDDRNDERWHALTEVERREILSLVSGYEALISWAEGLTCHESDLGERLDPRGAAAGPPRTLPRNALSAADYLKDERSRVARFRQEMGFLERRRGADTPSATNED